MQTKLLVCVVGPTAIGKTKMAINLARHYQTEIISADSRQFYRELSIGTAVPSKSELEQVPHHFIQDRSIVKNYSVGEFEQEALSKLDELYKKHDKVILVGGSGLYVNALLYGLDTFPKIDPRIRKELDTIIEKQGITELQRQLKELDPEYYEEVDLENPHRLIRALEIAKGSGRPYSSFRRGERKSRPFRSVLVGIMAEREMIYERINQRVDRMMEEGLLEEVKSLEAYKNLNALQTVGYRELFNFLEGNWDLDFAISEIKKNTRRFAKRQLTWFRKNEDIIWIEHDAKTSDVISKIEGKTGSVP